MKRRVQSGAALAALLAIRAASAAVSSGEMSSLPACAPEFREGPAISMESWLEGRGECRADETMLRVALATSGKTQTQLAGRAEEKKPAACEWEPAVAQPVC